jgi:hypothetical protein
MDSNANQQGGSRTKPRAPEQGEPREIFPLWAWIAAVGLALVTAYTIRQMGNQSAQLADLRKQMKLATLQNQALQNQLEQGRMVASIMLSPESSQVKLFAKDRNMADIRAYLHPHMGVAITADQLPAISPQRTFQFWIVTRNGMLVSTAIFRPDSNGQVGLVAPVTVPLNDISAMNVTEEPAGGSPQPTAPPGWSAQLK